MNPSYSTFNRKLITASSLAYARHMDISYVQIF
jgi:hypothetical protein